MTRMAIRIMPPSTLDLIFLVTALACFFAWRRAQSQSTGAFVRAMYARTSTPIFLRNAVAVVPLVIVGLVGAAFIVLVPRQTGQWLSLPVLLLIEAAFALSYRCPPSLLPRWLRDEIEAGITPPARPDWGDWLLFAIVVPIMVLGDLAGLILILFFSRPAG